MVAAGALLVLVAGCAEEADPCDDTPELDQVEGEALPVEVPPSDVLPGPDPEAVASAVPALDGFPSVTEQVIVNVRRETLEMAGRIGGLDAGRCDDVVGRGIGSVTRCTVTYEGVEVVWAVEVTGTPPGMFGGTDVEYATRLESGVLTAGKVYEQLAWNTQTRLNGLSARCEELPGLFPAVPGEDTGHRCQDVHYSCTDGVETYRWEPMSVGVDEEGFVEFGVPGD